jgi:hypothetical protein
MKKTFLVLVLFLSCLSVFSLDLSVKAGLGNHSFDTKQDTAITSGGVAGNFKPALFPVGQVRASGPYSDLFNFEGILERDPILRNRVGGEVELLAGPVSISAGPFIGLLNTPENVLSLGFSGGISLEIPGILFANLKAGTNLGSVKAVGDYSMDMTRISLGFWLPNLINTLSLSTKTFGVQHTLSNFIEDKLFRVAYSGEIYSKGVPYVIRIDMGYQSLTRGYTDTATSLKESDEFNSIFLGFEAEIAVTPLLKILFGAEMPVYSWGKTPLSRPKDVWLFQAHGGIIYSFDSKF